MKRDKHPHYQEVLFIDSSNDEKFIVGSTLAPKERAMYNGVEYPVCRISISSKSHPLFTGSKLLVDAERRVDKFKRRYSSTKK